MQAKINELSTRYAELVSLSDRSLKEQSLLHYNLGVFYTQEGSFRKAIHEFEQVIKADPEEADAHYNLGVIYAEHIIDPDKAVDHFRRFLELSPEDADADRARKYLIVQETIQGR